MNEKVNEYKSNAVLSTSAKNFVNSYNGEGEIPADIRLELEQIVKDFDPAEAEKELILKLKKHFEGIFNK